MKIRNLLVPLAALGLVALSGCRHADAPAEAPQPRLVGTQLVFPANHPHLAQLAVVAAAPARTIGVDLPARLVWNEDRTQRIYPAFAGRVARIGADLGQPVQPGTVLAQLASPDFGAAQADAAKAHVDASLAHKSLLRQRELYEAGIIARKDLDVAEADAARSQAEVQRAASRARLYGGGASVHQSLALTAGIAGTVVERNLSPGQELRPDQMGPGVPPLFVISDPSSLWVLIDARESEAATLRPGATFELTVPALPGQKFEGVVKAAADAIDPGTRTIKVRGLVPNPERLLKAEMLGTAHVERSVGAGVIVPAAAVSLRGSKHYVMVQARPGVFEPRDVVLGWQGPKEVLVKQGLEAGEQVVGENMLLLARQYRNALDSAGAGPEAAAAASAPPAATAKAASTSP